MFMLAILRIFLRRKEPECGSYTWQRLYFILLCIAASACTEIKFLNLYIQSNLQLLLFLNEVMCNIASVGGKSVITEARIVENFLEFSKANFASSLHVMQIQCMPPITDRRTCIAVAAVQWQMSLQYSVLQLTVILFVDFLQEKINY